MSLLKIFLPESEAETRKLVQDFSADMISSSQETGESVIELDKKLFREHHGEVIAFLRKMAERNDVRVRRSGTTLSPSMLVGFLDHLETTETEIRTHRHKSSDSPDGWGYPQLTSISRYLPETREELLYSRYWFSFGTFASEGVWNVDKNQIRAILKQEAEDKWLHLCPSFDFSLTEGIIDRLPDSIDTRNNPNWSVLHASEVEGSRVVRKPRGVVHKLSGSAKQEESETKPEKKEPERHIPDVRFDDIGGLESIIQQIREVIELPLKNPELFRHLGIKPHKGVLLYGAPGCGKTLIAKAIANETKAHFISVKGPELINKYYGQSEENLRNLFDEARKMTPSIIFFDEIDALAQKRSGADNLRMDSRFVNQLLTLMDGIEEYDRVCVIAATNRAELIDDALLRPGRFDYRLEVKKPNRESCVRIFKIATRDMPLAKGVDPEKLGDQLEGMTGADIAYIAREAAYNCLRRSIDMNGNGLKTDSAGNPDYSELVVNADDIVQAISDIEK